VTIPSGFVTAHKNIFYSGFTGPFCTFLSLPGTTPETWVPVQITLSALACVLVYRAGVLLVDRTTGVVSGFGLAVLWDSWLWTTVLYSTAIFSFAMACCLYAWARFAESPSRRTRLGVGVASVFLALSHPWGAPLVVGWVVSETTPRLASIGPRLFDGSLLPRLVSVASLALVPYGATRHDLPKHWLRGEIVANDPTYMLGVEPASSVYGFVTANPVQTLLLPVLRVALFFVPFFPRNSTPRIFLNSVTYPPLLLLAFYGAYRAARERVDLFRYAATPGVVMLGITAMMFVSWDLRYRTVLGPCIAVLAGYSVRRVLPETMVVE